VSERPNPSDPSLESLVARAADDFVERQKRGERPDVEEHVARYPQAAGLLRKVLASLRVLDLSAGGARADKPASSEDPVPGVLGDFRLLREVGRGGMGVVYEAEQISLGRRVALKVLPFAATMDERQLQRFHNEARAAAALDHPHIVPVYGVGCDRGVHFYAMRFIDGQPLSALLAPGSRTPSTTAWRRGPAGSDRPGGEPQDQDAAGVAPPPQTEAAVPTLPVGGGKEWHREVARLGIEAAEALEHAHSLGVVHRDVKPGNLLIDGQGKLYVTDFGLARTADAGLTLSGDLVGTLRYMSPEQALARHDLVDHRTDVYSLGATLYELLTGRPAVDGKDRQEILQKILAEEPLPPRRHERSIPRDLETVVLKALAKEPQRRYATAKELAEDLRRHLENMPVRARRPGLGERVAKWSRRHRTLVWSAAAGLLVALVTLGGSVGWVLRDEAARQAEAERVVSATVEEAEGLARQKRWPQALQMAERAASELAGRRVPEELGRRVRRILTDTRMVAKLEAAYMAKIEGEDWAFGCAEGESGYRDAFSWYGLLPEQLGVEQAARQIQGRLIQAELVAALDDWALLLRSFGGEGSRGWRHLLAVAGAADPDGWRKDVRDAIKRPDVDAVRRLAGLAHRQEVPAPTVVLLGDALRQAKAVEEAAGLLREAQRRHPADLWVNTRLAVTLHALAATRPEHRDEAIGFLRAAVALRPDSPTAHNNLGVALTVRGSVDEAILSYRKAIRLREDFSPAHLNLGNAFQMKGQLDEAIACYRQAIRLKGGYALAHNNLGVALHEKGQLDEAIASYRQAIQLEPGLAAAHKNLGKALQATGQLMGAVAAYRQAIRLRHDVPSAHNNLGDALEAQGRLDEAIASYREAIRLKRDYFAAHNNLGIALHKKGQLDEAITAYREAVRLKPDHAGAHTNLAIALREKRRPDEAVTAYRAVLRLKGGTAEAHYGLGGALHESGRLDEAIASYREAIRLKRDHCAAHNNLGIALLQKGQTDKAIASWRQAIRVCKDYRPAHHNLGKALLQKGQLDEAIAALREAVRLKSTDADTYYEFGNALQKKGQLDEAIAAWRQAIGVRKDHHFAHNNLGNALREKGQFDEAVTAFRQAIRLKGDYAEAHCGLGLTLMDKGDFSSALTHLRRGHELGSRNPRWAFPSARWIHDCQRLAELDAKLPAILRGEEDLADADAHLRCAWLCLEVRGQYAAAARFYRQAFDRKPELTAAALGHRYNAARAAALAAGKGADAVKLDNEERARLRGQALAWLRADLDAWAGQVEKGTPPERAEARRLLRRWQADPDFAVVRGPAALGRFPAVERAAWAQLWADVQALLDKVDEKGTDGR
jgi:eukaryotic-like serine/threonine-protein kinase